MVFGKSRDWEFLEADHKTAIVLDHSPRFARLSGYGMNISLKDPGTGQMRVAAAVQKSLWSYAVESALELHRIVDEIYPDGSRLMRFIVSDFAGRCLNPNWGRKLIASEELIESFSKCGVPGAESRIDASSCSILSGIAMAVEAMSELTVHQTGNSLILPDEDASLRSDLFSAAISEPRFDILSEREKIISSVYAKLCSKYMVRHDADIVKRKKERDAVVKQKLLFYARIVRDRSTKSDETEYVANKGSIIIFSSLESDKDTAEIEKRVTEHIVDRNAAVNFLEFQGADTSFAPITHVNLFVVNLQAVSELGKGKGVTAKPLTLVNEFLSSCVICAEAGASLQPVIRGLAVHHYNLASTTVTGIPMKEEAQQGQSVNYDVEILHPRSAHNVLEELGLLEPGSKLRSPLTPGGYDTVKLAWCTSSVKSQCFQYSRCASALTVSPANVNSRPSVCLTSFLLSLRNVMLEVPQQNIQNLSAFASSTQKVLSHMLMCHAGRIYIHTMWLGKHSIFDDHKLFEKAVVPKIDPQNLRLSDFVNLMKECQLTYDGGLSEQKPSTSRGRGYNEQARKHLKRITRYWPILLSDAFIYNIPSRFEPLLSLIRKEELTANDLNKCREHIAALIAFRDTKEPFTMKRFECKKLKLENREEQYKVAIKELLLHFRNYANNSDQHMEMFNMLLQISGLERSGNFSANDVVLNDNTDYVGPSTSFEHYQRMQSGDRNSSHDASSRSSSVDSRSQSRSNSPLPKRQRRDSHRWPPGEAMSLRDVIHDEFQKKRWQTWTDCVGRSRNVPLYAGLNLKDDSKATDVKGA